jgi:hypothetical protein
MPRVSSEIEICDAAVGSYYSATITSKKHFTRRFHHNARYTTRDFSANPFSGRNKGAENISTLLRLTKQWIAQISNPLTKAKSVSKSSPEAIATRLLFLNRRMKPLTGWHPSRPAVRMIPSNT